MKAAEEQALERCTFIINPSRYPEYAKYLKKILKRHIVPHIIESRSKEHFIEEVSAFCKGDGKWCLIWGGDGTAHDAINAYMRHVEQDPGIVHTKAIGFLRGGSGNGFQDSYEVPIRIIKQVEAYAYSISRGYTIDVDLMRLDHGGRYRYCQLAGFGLDAHVLDVRRERRYRMGKRKGLIRSGLKNYLASILRVLATGYSESFKRLHIELEDGKFALKGTRVNAEFQFEHYGKTVAAIQIEAGTRPYYAKFFKVCPDVVCNDGCIDVYIFNFKNRIEIVKNAVALWNGRHDIINKRFAKNDRPLIERYEVKRMRISSPVPYPYHVDGEAMKADTPDRESGDYRTEIRVVPLALPLIVPATFYRKFHILDSMEDQ